MSLVSPLLSRSMLLVLSALTDDEVQAIDFACLDPSPRGCPASPSASKATELIVRFAGGNARRALTAGATAGPGPPDHRRGRARDHPLRWPIARCCSGFHR